MARYVSTPGITINPIQEIASIEKRYNTRCLYNTPGNYTFTVPSGVCEILAVAVGPGSAPCTLLKCVDLYQCGAISGCIWQCNMRCCCYWGQCLAGASGLGMATLRRRALFVGVCVNPLSICGCSCYYCDGSVAGCFCYSSWCIRGQLACYFMAHVVGAGGGYSEKVITTSPGATYCVTVGGTCVCSFSCVQGQICATGPKVCKTTCPIITECICGGTCSFNEMLLNAGCTTQGVCCNGSGACCYNRFRCISCSGVIKATNDFSFCAVPGCGFGGTINRVGGFTQTDYSGTFNNTGAEIACKDYLICINRSMVCTSGQDMAGCASTYLRPMTATYENQMSLGFIPCQSVISESCCLRGYEYQIHSPLIANCAGYRCTGMCLCFYRNACLCACTAYCMMHTSVTPQDISDFSANCIPGTEDIYCFRCTATAACAPIWCCCMTGHIGCFEICKSTYVYNSYGFGCSGCGCVGIDGQHFFKVNSNITAYDATKFGGSSAGSYYGDGVSSMSDATYTKCICDIYGCDGVCCNYYKSRSFNCLFMFCACYGDNCNCYNCNCDLSHPFVPGCYCFYWTYGGYASTGCRISCTDWFRFHSTVFQPNNCPGVYCWQCSATCTDNLAIQENLHFDYLYVNPSTGGMALSNPVNHLAGSFIHSLLVGKVFNGVCNGCLGCNVTVCNNCVGFCNMWSTCQYSQCVPMNKNCACYCYFSNCLIIPGCNPSAISCLSGCGANCIPFTMTGLPDIIRWCSNGTRNPCIFCPCIRVNSCTQRTNCTLNYGSAVTFCTCMRCACTDSMSDYWPCCPGYNYINTTCKQINFNPFAVIYDFTCGLWSANPNTTDGACAYLQHPFSHRYLKMEMLGTIASDERIISAMMLGTSYNNSATGCCVFRSADKVELACTDFYNHFAHSVNLSECFCNSISHSSPCLCCAWCLQHLATDYKQNKVTYRNGACYDCSQVQGGAGTATTGNWNSCSNITATSTASGGYLKCVGVVCGGRCFYECPYLCVTGGGGQGAIVRPIMSFLCCIPCTNYGCQYIGGCIAGIEIVCAGSGYSTNPTITIYGGGGGCCCHLSNGCLPDRGCVVLCACIEPPVSGAAAYHISYGSGGGTVSGINNIPQDLAIIDSNAIQSVIPGRGGRGCEPPYEPFYYSYPGISAKVATRNDPVNFVGDKLSGCSWFDTKQIKGSGGNGCFTSPTFSYIHAQEGGPGGGGPVGGKSDGTLAGQGGVLGGGGGCCGTGGLGGGAGWCGTPGTGMVVIYWNV